MPLKKYHFFDREPDGMFSFAELHSTTRRHLEYLETKGFSWGTIVRYWIVTPDVISSPKKSLCIMGNFQGIKIEYWRYVPPSAVFCPTVLYVHGRRRRFNVLDLIGHIKDCGLPPIFLQEIDLAKIQEIDLVKKSSPETLIDWALKQKHYSSTTLKLKLPKDIKSSKKKLARTVAVCGERKIKIISF